MSSHSSPHETSLTEAEHEVVSLYALGLLSEADSLAFESHLADCIVCVKLVAEHHDAVGLIGLQASGVRPRADLEERLRARIHPVADGMSKRAKRTFEPSTPTVLAAAVGESYFLLSQDDDWRATEVAGVWSRTLHLDRANDHATMLFKMDPGATYPAHHHAAAEECFVLRGDLQVGDVRMQVGDYQFAASGSEHVAQSTEDGCVLLIRTSLSDELL